MSRKPRKGDWTPEEDARLEQLVDELEPKRRKDFDKLVDHGLRPRTGSSAMNRAEKLGLYEVAAPKKKRGPAWHAQGRKQGDVRSSNPELVAAAAAKRPKTAMSSQEPLHVLILLSNPWLPRH
jgi:hypothetical protein